MTARTHTEPYRPFRGQLRPGRLRFWPLFASGVRTATKRKIPLLLLYGPVAIGTVVFAFIVYGKYAAQDMPSVGGLQGMAALFAQRAMLHVQVKDQIAEFAYVMRFFTLLAVAWYGSGLLAEDRRVGAHQLYFARPLTRLDYLLGKFLTVAFFGALAMLVPGLVICLVAAWSSPEWSFFEAEGDVIWRTFAYSGLWIGWTSCLVLTVSSLVRRRTFALVGIFGVYAVNLGVSGVLGLADERFWAWNLEAVMRRMRNWIFEVDDWRYLGFSVPDSLLTLGLTGAVCLGILALRLRRLEVVA